MKSLINKYNINLRKIVFILPLIVFIFLLLPLPTNTLRAQSSDVIIELEDDTDQQGLPSVSWDDRSTQVTGQSSSGGATGGPRNNEEISGLVKCNNPPDCTFEELIATANAVMGFLVQIGIAFIAIVLAYAGWIYLTAGGDSGKIKTAHKMFRNSVIGFMIILGAFLVIKLLVSTLGLNTSIIKLIE